MAYVAMIDLDPVIVCPYDENHRIARSRLQRHLVKCEKNFPPDYKQQCPYDATHRVFQEEMVQHVEECPMKMQYMASYNFGGKIPPIDDELEAIKDGDEMWDTEGPGTPGQNPFNEPSYGPVPVRQIAGQSLRGNALIANKYGSKLRRPFGYSESFMIDIDNQVQDSDTESVTSDRGIGRGQGLIPSIRGLSIRGRGVPGLYRRGIRGRI
ncbi:hypothetical protein TKK_0004315 [Trichogramma kaykai]|uniref:CHHC U11-48K-type domain-containing protein n=1 Tax=Trichogramma kaykai TaxID=54128 RepID=A0ABD2XKN4_9HYME